MIRFLIGLCLFLVANSGFAQEQDNSGTERQNRNDIQQAFRLFDEGKYLAAQVALEALSRTDPQSTLQELASLRSFVGDYQGALEAMDRSQSLGQPNDKFDPSVMEGLIPKDAVEAIVERSKGRQVVVLNEAHHVPRHRAFAIQLAQRLRDEGFSYFAAEAFAPFTGALKRKGYPERNLGHYIREPIFGCLAREIVQLGFSPIAYDQWGMPQGVDVTDQINSREEAECQNLIKMIFSKDPKARVFIYCGFSHADERIQTTADGREVAWMGARLARETGLDPLTIDQTIQTERSDEGAHSPAWKFAREQGWLDKPIMLFAADGTPFLAGAYKEAVDLQVFHPPTKITEYGRPDWLASVEGRIPVMIPKGIVAESEMILVQAFRAIESETAIPFDQVVLKPNSDRPSLLLSAGAYRLVVQDVSGQETHREFLPVTK